MMLGGVLLTLQQARFSLIEPMDGDGASGTIYVLRSKSEHPLVAENRELIHKIGVTNLSVEKRIAGAHLQPTFLMANVEVVATLSSTTSIGPGWKI